MKRNRLAAAVLLSLAGCGGDTMGVSPIHRLTIDLEPGSSFWQGEFRPVSLRVWDRNERELSLQGQTVRWTTSDSSRIEVLGEQGAWVVAARAPGTATVSVSVGGVEHAIPVTIAYGGFVHLAFAGTAHIPFNAAGPRQPDRREWVTLTYNPNLFRAGVTARQVQGDGYSDDFELYIPVNYSESQLKALGACSTAACGSSIVRLSTDSSDPAGVARRYDSIDGTVQLMSFDGIRLIGSVSGRYCPYREDLAQTPCAGSEAIVVSGHFDVSR